MKSSHTATPQCPVVSRIFHEAPCPDLENATIMSGSQNLPGHSNQGL